MNPQFVETLKMTDGKVANLSYHQARMERTLRHFFPTLATTHMPCLQQSIVPQATLETLKVRVVYGAQGIETIEYIPYTPRTIRTLRIVTSNTIDYTYKSTDRSALNALLAQRGTCDDIVILKTILSQIPRLPTSPYTMAINGSPHALPYSLVPNVQVCFIMVQSKKPTSPHTCCYKPKTSAYSMP